MPWTKDINGDDKYKVSIYAKEELPTWNEVYNEFYKEKVYSYTLMDPKHQEMDLYWKIPHMKYLIMTVCNQFNKMIFEDGYKESLLEMINENIHEEATDVMFLCKTTNHTNGVEFRNKYVYINNYKPPIYTIPLPTGNINPFIVSMNELRVSSNDLVGGTWIFPLILSRSGDAINHFYAPHQFGVCNTEKEYEDFTKIIDFMIKPFKEYFEGEGVGWKDSNGKIIEGDPGCSNCIGSGYNPR